MQEVNVRKAFISGFIFAAAFVMGVVMSSPASAQTDVVIEHRGMCHDAAWFDTQPYQFDVPFGNMALMDGIWDASNPKARFHVGITNNSANDIEAYVRIPPDGVGGPLYTQGVDSDVLYPMGPTDGTLGGGAFTFLGNAVIANGETAYIDYAPSITNGPEDVIVVIVQDGVTYEQAPVSRSCTAEMEMRDVSYFFQNGDLKMRMTANAGKVIQWARSDGVYEGLSEIIPLLAIQDENGNYVQVLSANGGFSSTSSHLYTGHEWQPSLSRHTYSGVNLSDQYPSLQAENICSATEPVNMQIKWATEEPFEGDMFQRILVDFAPISFTVDPTDFQDDCEAEGFELIPDPCQYDANLFENDPACVPPPTPTPVPTPTPEPTPTPTPGPDQDTDEDGVPDKDEEDPSCVDTKDCDEDNLEDLPDGDDLDPDQDDDGIKDGDEIEGCVLDPDPECDAEILAVTGISTNRLLLYAFALMGLASMFVYSGRVFQRES